MTTTNTPKTSPIFSSKEMTVLMDSIRRVDRLRKMTNEELSHAVMDVWASETIWGVHSDILSEVIDRLLVIDIPPEEICRLIDEQHETFEMTDEEAAAMDKAFERVMDYLNGDTDD